MLADWTGVTANVASGMLLGGSVSLAGAQVSDPPSSIVDGGSSLFSDPYFTPSVPSTDAIEIRAGAPGLSYTLEFGKPIHDPILDFGSLSSTLEFLSGTSITRISGTSGFAVARSAVTGSPDATVDASGGNDSSGTVMLNATFASMSFEAVNPAGLDGIYVQVGVTVAGPQTEILLNPTYPAPGGAYAGPVRVFVGAIDGAGAGSVDTRCELDPAAPRASFGDLPDDCPYLRGGPSQHAAFTMCTRAASTSSAPRTAP